MSPQSTEPESLPSAFSRLVVALRELGLVASLQAMYSDGRLRDPGLLDIANGLRGADVDEPTWQELMFATASQTNNDSVNVIDVFLWCTIVTSMTLQRDYDSNQISFPDCLGHMLHCMVSITDYDALCVMHDYWSSHRHLRLSHAASRAEESYFVLGEIVLLLAVAGSLAVRLPNIVDTAKTITRPWPERGWLFELSPVVWLDSSPAWKKSIKLVLARLRDAEAFKKLDL